jgi:ACR3 family arsenite efflux pump ArsB
VVSWESVLLPRRPAGPVRGNPHRAHLYWNAMLRFNLVFRKYILLWVLLAMVVGYLAGKFNPQRVDSLTFLITPLAFVMIFIMVLPSNLPVLFKLKFYLVPLMVSGGLFLLSPFIAYAAGRLIPQSFSFLRTGIMISSAVPPDAMLSAWSGLLEADLLFSLLIQSFLSFTALFLMPFGLPFLFDESSYFSLFILLKNLFVLIVIPFVLGGVLKVLFRSVLTRDFLRKIKPTFSSVSGIIALFIILLSVALRARTIGDYPIMILWGFLSSSLYYALSFALSLYVCRLLRFDYEAAIPIIFQSGSRNLPVAMVVALTSFKHPSFLGVAACILAQFPVAALFYSLYFRSRVPGNRVEYVYSEEGA